jgi:ABC-type transport system involved in multi-copper enzyme maturation permease subunit
VIQADTSIWRGGLSGSVCLAVVSFRRLFRSRQTIVSAMLLGFALMVALAWSMRRGRTPEEFISQILIPVYTSFLLPIFCLCYATASIASEREDQTLTYLLLSPLPRPMVYVAKFFSSLVLALLWTMGGLILLCQVVGDPGQQTLAIVWPTVMASTLAYVGLFHLFGVMFRRATIVGFAYALFLENFVGSMPGIVKRVAVSFYTECLIFDSAAIFGLGPAGHHDEAMYLPISAATAMPALWLIALATLLAGIIFFSRHEYSGTS